MFEQKKWTLFICICWQLQIELFIYFQFDYAVVGTDVYNPSSWEKSMYNL